MSELAIIIISLAIASMASAFTKPLPAAAIAYAVMLAAHLSGVAHIYSGALWFWGVAAAIVTANYYLTTLPPLPQLRWYTAGGALAGCMLGLVAGTQPALIVGGAAGGALGFLAFRLSPKGAMKASWARTLSLFADVEIPACVAFYIAFITITAIVQA